MSELFKSWFDQQPVKNNKNITILVEKDGGRKQIIDRLPLLVADHLVELDIIERMGGFSNAANVIKNRIPFDKKVRSGDFGEILVTEYINRETNFKVPIRRLRYKDDRSCAMRGDDVVGIRKTEKTIKVVKGEAKSRESLSPSVVQEASEALANYNGRPNPSTLAFISYILRKENRDDEAKLFEDLQNRSILARNITHLVFTVSGNDPTNALVAHEQTTSKGVLRRLTGCQIQDYPELIYEVFENCLKLKDQNGNH